MPKKYGTVKISLDGKTAECSVCNYTWKPNEEEINEYRAGHTVSCLNCRAMNMIKSGELVGKNQDFRVNYEIGYKIKGYDADRLRGDNYLDEEIDVTHVKCNRTMSVKLSNLRRNEIECAYCKNAVKVKSKEELPSVLKEDKQYIIETKTPDIEVGTDSFSITKLKVGNIIGDNVRIVEIDKNNNTVTIQCTRCGIEVTKNIGILKTEASRKKYLMCESCKRSKLSSSELLYKLRQRYIGKVYNGLEIENIYINKNSGAIKCDVVCLHNIRNVSMQAYISTISSKESSNTKRMFMPNKITHQMKNIPLGDVINKRVYCKECGDTPVNQNKALFTKISTCPNFIQFRVAGKKPVINIGDMTMGQFYKDAAHGYLCNYCNMKKECKLYRLDPRVGLSVFVNEIDYNNEVLKDMLKLVARYPSLFKLKKDDADAVKIVGDLIVIKDAYVGRNGDIYKVCLCKIHGKELILNETEISNFNHKECIDDSPYMRIYNMPSTMYLSSK